MNVIIRAYSKAKEGNLYLSKNFQVKEFACKDGSDVVFIAPAIVVIGQAVRDWAGDAVILPSAYRTPTYNKKVGGAEFSQHMYGCAIDIQVKGKTSQEVYYFCDKLIGNKGGVGLYDNFVHADCRGYRARWTG